MFKDTMLRDPFPLIPNYSPHSSCLWPWWLVFSPWGGKKHLAVNTPGLSQASIPLCRYSATWASLGFTEGMAVGS